MMLKNVQYIVLEGQSGRVPWEWEYRDTLLITAHSAEYECKPYIE